MAIFSDEQFVFLFPKACAWTAEKEAHILQFGTELSDSQVNDAHAAGVSNPDKVRLLGVQRIALPKDPELARAALAFKLITPDTGGLTLGHGVFLVGECLSDRLTIVHELVHVSQYERLGGIPQFLRAYLHECNTIGYPNGPLEQEARKKSREICT